MDLNELLVSASEVKELIFKISQDRILRCIFGMRAAFLSFVRILAAPPPTKTAGKSVPQKGHGLKIGRGGELANTG